MLLPRSPLLLLLENYLEECKTRIGPEKCHVCILSEKRSVGRHKNSKTKKGPCPSALLWNSQQRLSRKASERRLAGVRVLQMGNCTPVG